MAAGERLSLDRLLPSATYYACTNPDSQRLRRTTGDITEVFLTSMPYSKWTCLRLLVTVKTLSVIACPGISAAGVGHRFGTEHLPLCSQETMPDNPDNIDHNVGASDKRREIGLLVDQLGGRSRSDRAAAEFALKKLGATAIPALVNALQLEKRKKDIWFICALCSCYLCILPSHLMEVWHLPFVVRALYTAGMGLGPMSLARFAVQPNKKQKSIVRLLVNAEDINVIGPLVEALTYGGRHDVEVLKTVTAGLVRLLPQLRASDAHLLNDKQRTHLRRALLGKDKPLTLAILKALQQIGDIADLPFVEKIWSRAYP
jgi:hypothetical protein